MFKKKKNIAKMEEGNNRTQFYLKNKIGLNENSFCLLYSVQVVVFYLSNNQR